MADLQVTLALLLENQEELARELERTGGIAGKDFGNGLSEGAKKAFQDLVNQADKAAKEAGVKFNKTKLQFESPSGEVIPKQVLDRIGKTIQGFNEARRAVDAFKSAASQATRDAAKGFNFLNAAITGVSIALTNRLTDSLLATLGSVRNLIGGFIDLDSELRLAAAAAGEQGGYQRLSTVVDRVGIEAAGTTKEVAQLATSLVRAGFSIKEVEDALPGIVRGAEATGTKFEEFGSIVSDALNSFGINASETGRVVDIMAKTVNSSNAQMEDLSYTFKYSASTAKAVGISIEELAAATGLLANVGIRSSVAGTGLRTMIEQLGKASGGASEDVLALTFGQERLAKAMAKVGASVIDVNGNMLPLENVLISLKEGFSELSQADQIQLANILFGDEAGNKFLAIVNQNTQSIREMFSEVRDSAGSTDAAREEMNGFGLELKKLEGTIGSISNDTGEVFVSILKPALGIANELAGSISGLPGPIKTTAILLVSLGGAALTAGIGVKALNLAILNLGGIAHIRNQIAAITTSILGPFASSIIIVAALAASIGLATGQIKDMDSTTKQVVSTMVSLGVAVAVLKAAPLSVMGIVTAFEALRKVTTLTAAATAVLSSLTGGIGLAKVGLAIAAGAATYAALNLTIKETSQETSKLSEEQRILQDEIDQTRKLIGEQQELGLKTGSAEKRLTELEMKKSEIAEPLEFNLEIDQAEKKIKLLNDKLKETKNEAEKITIQVQVKSTKEWESFLTSLRDNKGLGQFSKPLQEAGKQIKENNQEIKKLYAQKIKLPIEAVADNVSINKKISELQDSIKSLTIQARIDINKSNLEKELKNANAELAQAPLGDSAKINDIQKRIDNLNVLLSRGKDEQINRNQRLVLAAREITQSEEDQLNLIKLKQEQEEALIDKKLALGQISDEQASREIASIKLRAAELEKEVNLKKFNSLSAQDQRGALSVQLQRQILGIEKQIAEIKVSAASAARQASQELYNLAQKELDLAIKALDIDKQRKDIAKNRLGLQADVANAELNVFNSRQGLARSEFDLQKARVNYALKLAEERMQTEQSLVDEGDLSRTQSLIQATNEVNRLKAQGEKIDFNALESQIRGAEQRFELESKILQIKQQMAEIDARSAMDAARLSTIQSQQALIELESKLKDPSTSGESAGLIYEQISLQRQAILLSQEQERAARDRFNSVKQIGELEKASLNYQQQAIVNTLRAEAATNGWEGSLNGLLTRLDEASAGISPENSLSVQMAKKLEQQIDNQIRLYQKTESTLVNGKIYEAMDLAISSISESIESASNQFVEANKNAEALKATLESISGIDATKALSVTLSGSNVVLTEPRFAGGDVIPGKNYTINEIGRESFLSDSGQLSWINSPANSRWRPPSRGVVIPANVSQYLADAGVLPGGNRSAQGGTGGRLDRVAHSIGVTSGVVDNMMKQTLAMGRLQRSIDKLTAKDWSVTVPVPSNARLLRTIGGF